MSALLLDLRPGDVVGRPSYTFVSTVLAFACEGVEVRFCDIGSTTLAAGPEHASERLDSRLRAVVLVQYAGIGCDLTRPLEPTGTLDSQSARERRFSGGADMSHESILSIR